MSNTELKQTFIERLVETQQCNASFLCAGIDPDEGKLPRGRNENVWGNGGFNHRLLQVGMRYVDYVAQYSCIFKPNLAFWAAHGAEDELAFLIDYAQDKGLMVILDAKYGDIGNTAKFYAKTAFERFGADAVTVNAYLGSETLAPWLEYGDDKAIFVLCHTSNPGAGEFQEQILKDSDMPLFLHLAERVTAQQSEGKTQIGLVMGATYPEQLDPLMQVIPTETTPLLLPGVGKQGGALEETVKRAQRCPFVINSSGGLLHASQKADFAEVAARKADELRCKINRALVLAA